MERFLDTKLMHPREQVVKVIDRIYRRGMTTTSGGNISIIDDEGNIWVTPSAVDKGSLRATDIVCVKADGTIEGRHKPSSEFPFHKAIYDIRPGIKAIIHAHPPALVSFSIVHQIPDTNIIGQAKSVCGEIGYAAYELPGSDLLGERIAVEFRKGYKAIIMENHGTVLGGSDMADAYQRFETLELCSRTILNAKTIGDPHYLTNQQIEGWEAQVAADLPEFEAVNYPSDELQKRAEIHRLVHRACNQGLMISSYGTVSVRWRDNDFLITPRDIPRWNLQPDDIVRISNGMREKGKKPSRATWLHQQIYLKNPGINSIILTQPPYLMAYGATRQPLDVRTIPESWIFLQDIPSLPFGTQFMGNNTVPDMLSKNTPAILIQNDSVVVTGGNLLQAFDRLEVAEFSAQSLVMAKSIGELIPINEKQVEDLRMKFLG
jgi:L-fuculose-phosphate aldolase